MAPTSPNQRPTAVCHITVSTSKKHSVYKVLKHDITWNIWKQSENI